VDIAESFLVLLRLVDLTPKAILVVYGYGKPCE